MGKYTYTASLVDESVNILKRADQELSGTNAAVINAVNTILNARGADRLAFDFDDILDITDFARDDISAVTKEILNKQAEIEEYENAPWWKKLFASIGMALLKFIEGHAQTIEYVFDLAVSLAGFIGGLFNSEFKSACKEFVEKEHVDNWFTKQYINEDGLFHWVNSNSIFSYNSTAANIIEFGGSLINSLGMLGTSPINGAVSLYKSFENLIDNSDINAITTSTPIIAPKIKEIFEIEEVEDPPSLQDEPPIDDGTEGYPIPEDITEGEDQFKPEEVKDEDEKHIEGKGGQVLYGPPLPPVFEEQEPLPPKPEEPVKGEEVTPPPAQVLYGPPPGKKDEEFVAIEDVTIPGQVLYGPPPIDPKNPGAEQLTTDKIIGDSHGGPTAGVHIPKASSTEEITKKTVGSFGDLIDGVGSTPISSKPLSSKDNHGEGQMAAPLASGVIAAGVAGWGTKTYIDKRKSNSEDDKDKELEAEKWDEDPDNLSVDYQDGIMKDIEGDYLSPEDELAFTD